MEVAVIGAAVACVIGWHASMAHGSHRGIPVRRGQLRGFRRERAYYGIRMLGAAALLTLILVVLVLH
jgi:hypothetical protein